MARASTFTSYINSELPSNVDANFARLEQVATRTYGNISRSAEQASRAAAGLLSGRGTAGGGQVTRQLQRQADTARAVAEVNGRVVQSANRATAAIKQEGAAAERAARQNSQLVTNLRAVSTSLNVVQGPLGPIAGRVSALAGALTELTGFRLGLAGVASGLFVIGSLGTTYTNLTNQLAAAYQNQQDYNRATYEVVGIANRARTSLDAVAGLYIRIGQAAEQAGISQGRAARVTELAAKAAKLSGGSTQAQDAALVQFTQAFGADFKGGGQELQSILEGANQLGAAIAKGLGVPIGQLKVLGEQGKLSAEVVTKALENAAADIETRYARMPKTMGQASAEFINNLTVMIGGLDKATGFTGTLAGVISAAANSMNFLASATLGVAAGFAAIKLGTFINQTATSIKQQQVMASALTQLGVRRQQQAAQSLAQHQREYGALEAEQQQIRETIALLERRARVSAREVGRASTPANFRNAIAEERAALGALAGERQRLNVINGAAAAANDRVTASQKRLDQATKNVTARSGFLRSAVGNLIGAFNLWGIAAGAVTGALIYLIMRAEKTDEVLQSMGNTAIETARKALGLAAANRDLAKSYYEVARAAAQKDLTESRQAYQGVRGEFAGRLSAVGQRIRSSGRPGSQDAGEQLLDLANRINRGQIKVADAMQQVRAAQKRWGGEFFGSESGLGFKFPGAIGTSGEDFDKNLVAAFETGTKYREAFRNFQEVQREIEKGSKGPVSPLSGTQAFKTSDLRGQAQAAALDKGTDSIRAAGIRRKEAYRVLDAQMGIDGGKVPGAKAEEYRTRAAEIERTYNTEVEGIKAASRARAGAGREARAAAAQEKRDAREVAQARLDAGMLDLEKRKPQLGQDEYLAARVALLRTYDQEIESIDQAAAHSSRAAQQMIRDARAVQQQAAQGGERRRDILGQWEDQPRAMTRARDQVDDLNRMVDTMVDGVAQISAQNPLGTGIYTQQMADADAARIMRGVRQPLAEATRDYNRFVELSALRLQGLDAEAAALERALSIQDTIGQVSREEFQTLVDQERQQQAINDALGARARLTSVILDSVQQTRDSFEQLLVDLPQRGPQAAADFFRNMQRQVQQVWARRITERLFAGSDDKVRQLVSGRDGVEQAYQFLSNHATSTGTQLETLASAALAAADALNQVASTGGGDAPLGTQIGDAVASALGGQRDGPKPLGTQIGDAVARALGGGSVADVVVTAKRVAQQAKLPADALGGLPTGKATYNTLFEAFGANLDKTFGTKFFKSIGKEVGGAFEGAGQGMIAGSVASMLGIKTSQTGSAIGGALGSFLPIPGGSFIGGALGGILGGLFQKPKYGNAGISLNQWGEVVGGAGSGRGKDQINAAAGQAGSLADAINMITGSLGASISSLPGVTIGSWDGKARVALTSTTQPLHSKSSAGKAGLIKDFGEGGEQAAIEYAIRYVIGNAVITGISQASINILKSGQDLQLAIQKATAIESIPKRLMRLTDPVRAAVTELNTEFEQLIKYLQEGGATAEQFADAQKLYDLERAEAIKQATEQAVGAIEQFMNDMIGSSSSPLNRRTVYQNAQTELQKLAADVNAGKVVDQNDLLGAAKNFQDASRGLYGSSQQFFSDFQMLYDLLAKAKGNALQGGLDLPGSPFGPAPGQPIATIDQYNGVAGLIGATNNQTESLGSKLDEIASLLRSVQGSGYDNNDRGRTLDLLRMN